MRCPCLLTAAVFTLVLGEATQGCRSAQQRNPDPEPASASCSASGRLNPTQIAPSAPDNHRVRQIALSWSATCAVIEDNTVWCWGSDASGALGWNRPLTRNDPSRSVPTKVADLEGAESVAVEQNQVCALLLDGTVKCWGSRSSTGFAAPTDRVMATTVPGLKDVARVDLLGSFGCARRKDKSYWCWRRVAQPAVEVPTDEPVAAVASDFQSHVCALFDSGRVACGRVPELSAAGNNPLSDLQTVPNVQALNVAVSARGRACATLKDGRVSCWLLSESLGKDAGAPDKGPQVQPGLKGIKQVSLANNELCVRDSGPNLRCLDPQGRITHQLEDVKQVATGPAHSCAVDSKGVARCWGSNYQGQFGNGNRISNQEPQLVVW